MKNPLLSTILAVSVIAFNLSACKFGDSSRGKALQQGILVGERSQDPTKTQVLIHISNNPVNTNTFLAERAAILKSYDEAIALVPEQKDIIKNAKDLYEQDWNEHTKALAADIADIKIGICHAYSGIPSGVVIINNSSIVNRNFQYCPLNEVDQRVPVALTQKILDIYDRIKVNKIYESSPLSHPEILQASLEMVTKLFPPEKHEYSLVIKSHGNAELAITSKVAFESSLVTGKFIARYFKSRPPARAVAMLDKGGYDKGGLDKGGLDKGGLDKGGYATVDVDIATLEKGGLEGPAAIESLNIRAAGVSKEQLLQIVLNPEHKMFFNVIFLESCNSDIGALAQDLAETPHPNIGYLYTSDKQGLGYSTLNYQSARDSKIGSLRAWLIEELNKAAAKSI